ncbi:hypothetical protein B0H14DRAFT_2568368 [Mycena olivaceomarginata]|nr:hypothetical protein B0H14DRAFT_2568368 [Mycena olivaceomarginata]
MSAEAFGALREARVARRGRERWGGQKVLPRTREATGGAESSGGRVDKYPRMSAEAFGVLREARVARRGQERWGGQKVLPRTWEATGGAESSGGRVDKYPRMSAEAIGALREARVARRGRERWGDKKVLPRTQEATGGAESSGGRVDKYPRTSTQEIGALQGAGGARKGGGQPGSQTGHSGRSEQAREVRVGEDVWSVKGKPGEQAVVPIKGRPAIPSLEALRARIPKFPKMDIPPPTSAPALAPTKKGRRLIVRAAPELAFRIGKVSKPIHRESLIRANHASCFPSNLKARDVSLPQPPVAILDPVIPLAVRVQDQSTSDSAKVQIEVRQITRWKSEDIAKLEVKGKPSRIETELAPGKVPKRNDKAELPKAVLLEYLATVTVSSKIIARPKGARNISKSLETGAWL